MQKRLLLIACIALLLPAVFYGMNTQILGAGGQSVVAGAAYFLEDYFTEAGDTALENHTSDSGGAWSGGDTTNFDVVSATNEVANDSADSYHAVSDETPGSANYYVEVNGKAVNGDGRVGASCRWADATHFYYFYMDGIGDTYLYINNGGWNLLDSDSEAGYNANTYYDVKIECNGTAIKGYIDSVENCSAVDGNISAIGLAGINTAHTDARITSVLADEL